MTTATPDAEVLAQHEVLPSHAEGGISNPVLGMLLFITSEIMFFAGLFAAYFALRAGYTEVVGGRRRTSGRRPSSPPAEAAALILTRTTGSGLNLILPATIILVMSSFTCQFGVWAIRRGDRPHVHAQLRGHARPGHHLPR